MLRINLTRKQVSARYYKRHKEKIDNNQILYRKRDMQRTVLASAKHRASRRGLPFNISREDVPVPEFCPVLGIKLEVNSGKPQYNSPSIDRFIPELGYVKGNVTVISHRANTLKNNATVEELTKVVLWMKKVNKYL